MSRSLMVRFFVGSPIVAWMTVAGCAPARITDAAPDDVVTTGSLYEEMIDLEGLTRFPEPSYKTVQYSSYDRRSNLPEGPDWFANSDGFGGEPIPGFEAVLREPGADSIGEYLLAEVDGPGALVRMWTARIDGEVKLWLDGTEEPLIEGSADTFLRRPLSFFDEADALDQDAMVGTLYQRDGTYAPIPFDRGMRLVWIGNLAHTHFYQVEVRRYEAGTRVETFRPEALQTYAETINEVMGALADPDGNLPTPGATAAAAGPSFRPFDVTIEPGEAVDALELEGSGAVRRLELKVEAEDVPNALRQTVLLISADEHQVPQVESPVGDFFGAAPGVNPYQSLPFTIQPDGHMISRWVMPFASGLRIRFENHGAQPVTVRGSAGSTDYDWDADRSMHFRARWRVDQDMVPAPDAVQDVPFILARGQGVYVGTTSLILNPNPVPTPYGSWWGEGDEKVFVDGDVQPSLFGTGSEDYYNYSWSSPDIFAYPYCGQPVNDGPGNRGFVTNYRWHVLDPLPFQDEIRFYMEAYPHERTPGFTYARIGYHYGRPGMTDDHEPLIPDDLRAPQRPTLWTPAPRMGARNSVMYQTEELGGGAGVPFEYGTLYAGGRLPVWRPRAAGDSWNLRIPVMEDGEYRIHFVARLDPSAGTLQVRWDGQTGDEIPGTGSLNLHRPYRTLLRNFTLSPGQLTRGNHTLELVFEGAPDEVAPPEIGVDFVWVQSVG